MNKTDAGVNLLQIHSALDDALGDTDISHIESDDELREEHPVQWAAQKLMEYIDRAAPARCDADHIGEVNEMIACPYRGPFGCKCVNECKYRATQCDAESRELRAELAKYAHDLRHNQSGGDDYPWEVMRAVANRIEEILSLPATEGNTNAPDRTAESMLRAGSGDSQLTAAVGCKPATATNSTPSQGGEPVAWQKRPTFGEPRLWSWCPAPEDDNHDFWIGEGYEIRPLYASPPVMEMREALPESRGLEGEALERENYWRRLEGRDPLNSNPEPKPMSNSVVPSFNLPTIREAVRKATDEITGDEETANRVAKLVVQALAAKDYPEMVSAAERGTL